MIEQKEVKMEKGTEMLRDQNNTQGDVAVSATPDENARQVLLEVYRSLLEKGYNPVMQIVGYLTTEDPTYIPNYNRARELISGIDRDELLCAIVRHYFEKG